MERKIKHYALLLLLYVGCQTKKHPQSEMIIGKWYSYTDWANLSIEFNSDSFFYNEKINNLKFVCGYKIYGETLMLLRGDNIDKHIIFKVDKKELKFNAIDTKKKDVSFIDGLDFRKNP